MFNKKRKGFTLIELLVVIAIIGLLAGIVLVSLGGARNEARDARVTAAMGQARTIAELVYNSSNPISYAGVCDGTNTLNDAHVSYGADLDAIEDDVSGNNGGTLPSCRATANAYCTYAPVATAATWYCVDSTGKAGETTTDPSGAGLCTATTFVCP